ncbi:RNA polymerase-binding protein DksA [Desulforegula conservatrix]|uniref:RNA polymerase-binding protein DksA n=1 Tax=Desulforegula conservatrix TaxID=153026 RepID=UPI0004116B8A|nr:RNA polymerase-binding protein DksA [Desulforegula conservatrix]
MDKEQQELYRGLLLQQLQELLEHADDTVVDMTNQAESYPDPTDRATHESDQSFTLRIRDREHKLIKKIKQAIERIDNGNFGICESCGEDISFERLKARPVAEQCIECKTKAEALEKVLGV